MPTSYWRQIPDVIEAVLAERPITNVLELGIGCGKYGVLLREYLDVWDHYFEPWGSHHTTIEGVEIFETYRCAAWGAYDAVLVTDAMTALAGYGNRAVSVVLLVDMLEHFDHDDGMRLLAECVRVGKAVVIGVPTDPGDTVEVWGNPREIHRARYTPKDFMRFGKVTIHRRDDATVATIRGGQ